MSWPLFGSELALASGATLVSGITTIAAGISRDHTGRHRPTEPTLSVGLVLIYLPLAYLAAWAMSTMDSSLSWLAVVGILPIMVHSTAKTVAWRARSEYGENLMSIRGVSNNRIRMCSIYVGHSPADYRNLIVPAESIAREVDRIPKRLSVVFKGPDTIRLIAQLRFGEGSSSIRHYVEEHEERTRTFFAALRSGMRCREIYSRDEVKEYVLSGSHGTHVRVPSKHIRDNLRRWLHAIEAYEHYTVALTNEKLPFKYEIVDGEIVIIHEAIGANDRGRLNSIAIEGDSAVNEFVLDFDTIWDRVPVTERSKAAIASWIRDELLPLTSNKERGSAIEK